MSKFKPKRAYKSIYEMTSWLLTEALDGKSLRLENGSIIRDIIDVEWSGKHEPDGVYLDGISVVAISAGGKHKMFVPCYERVAILEEGENE